MNNPHALRDWNELPEWIQEAYHKDVAVQHVVKDWRMTKQPLEVLFEKLAKKMYELKNTWEMTATQNFEKGLNSPTFIQK